MMEIALTCANAILNVDAEGTFHLRWAPGSSVSAADADAVVAAIRGVAGYRLQPLLVEVVEVFMSLESRVALQGTRFVSAVALVGAVVDRVMAAAVGGSGTVGTTACYAFVHVLMVAIVFVLLLVPALERWVDQQVMHT